MTNRLWVLWKWVAEEVLLALPCPRPTWGPWTQQRLYWRHPCMCPTRGTNEVLKVVRLCPYQQWAKGSPATCLDARLTPDGCIIRFGFVRMPLSAMGLDG